MTETKKSMKWMDALKEYNSKTGKSWIIPKKDTEEYNEVKKIQTGGGITIPIVESNILKVKKPRKKRVLLIKDPVVPIDPVVT